MYLCDMAIDDADAHTDADTDAAAALVAASSSVEGAACDALVTVPRISSMDVEDL